MTPVTFDRLLAEYHCLIAAAEDHLDHLPAKVRLTPIARTLADQIDHARSVAYEADDATHHERQEVA